MAGKCPVCAEEYTGETAYCARDGTKLRPFDEAFAMMEDEDPLVGALVGGRYRVLKRIGEGGMGVVYIAEHEAIEKKLAIKVLKDQYALREDVVARFQQEAKSASRVKHEGVLEVFDFGRTDDHRFYIAMELLDGRDLACVLEKEISVPPIRAVRIAVQIARALAAAHGKGIIHRDLKPENVFIRIGDDGREHVKIVDFGIAQLRAEGEDAADPNAKVSGRKLTKTGMIFGTPEYMSPEQAAGKSIDARVDVYALGVILFEMLSGRTPFHGETFMAILSAHLTQPLPTLAQASRPGFACSDELEAVVRRALSKEPADRFRSMGELAEALIETPEGSLDQTLKPAGPRFLDAAPISSRAATVIAETDIEMIAPRVSIRGGDRSYDANAATIAGEIEVAPASTSTEATIAPVLPKRGSGAVFVVLALFVLGGAGGFFMLRSAPKSTAPASSVEPVIPAPIVSAAPSPSPSVTASAEPPQVAIRVETTPPGAIIEREVGSDWLQVCDKSPCEVKVAQGSTVHVRASLNGKSADKRLLADQPQKAQLIIPVPAATKPAATKPPAENMCEYMSEEGLKLWRPCGKN